MGPEDIEQDRLETESALARIKANAQWEKANPSNPVCPVCDFRFNLNSIRWPLLDGTLVCAECADNEERAIMGDN